MGGGIAGMPEPTEPKPVRTRARAVTDPDPLFILLDRGPEAAMPRADPASVRYGLAATAPRFNRTANRRITS